MRSPYVARTALRDGREVVCHVLGRVRLLCDPSALEVLAFFSSPRPLGDLDGNLGEGRAAHARRIFDDLKGADLILPEASHEVERIKQLFTTVFDNANDAKTVSAPLLVPAPASAPDDAELTAQSRLLLSASLAVFPFGKNALVTHPLERRLELAEDAWRFAREFREGASVEAAARRARLATGTALDACRFLVRKKILWPSRDAEIDQLSAWCDVASSSPVLRLDTGCEQWEQRFRPYRVKDLGPVRRTALVASIGACQVHASTPALQYLGQLRGLAIDVDSWFGIDLAALGSETWSLILLSVATQLVQLYEAVALGDAARCRSLARGVGAQEEQTVQQIRAQTGAPILLHSVGHPGLAAYTPEAPATHAMNAALAEVNAALLARISGYERVHLLDQDRVVADYSPGLHWDDEYNALRHHSCISMWGRPPRDLATSRYAAPNPAAPEVPPIPDGQADPVTPFALAHLDFLERLAVSFPIELILFEPNELLWPGKLETKDRPYGEKFNFYTGDNVSKNLGLNEALTALAARGVTLGCISSCPPDLLRKRWRLPTRLPTLLLLERIRFMGGDAGEAGVTRIIDDSKVPPERVLLLNLPPGSIPKGFSGARRGRRPRGASAGTCSPLRS